MHRLRVPRWLIVGILTIGCLQACGPRVRQQFAVAPGDLWIRNVTLISMNRDEPLANTDVVIRAGRIAWIGAAAASMVGVSVLDGTGRYLVPGLIDGHVHVDAPLPGMSESQRAGMPELVRAYEEQLPCSYLYFGFTTVVDLGNL